MALVLLAGESQSSELRRLVHTTPCLTIVEHTMPRYEPGLLVLCSSMVAGYKIRLDTFEVDVLNLTTLLR